METSAQLQSSLGRIVLGADEPRRMPLWVIGAAMMIHIVTGGVAWWQEPAVKRAVLPKPRPPLQLDRMVEIVLPKPKPEPIAEPPKAAAPQPKVVEKPQPQPKPMVSKKAVVRKSPKAVQTEPAQAAQVIAQTDPQAAAASSESFDIVTGGGERYAGGVTSTSGKSKSEVRQIIVSYEQMLLAWMERHKRYPPAALRRRLQGRPIMEIQIDRGGHLIDYRVTESSHYAELDQAALAMIQRAEPFPAVPPDHAANTFTFRFGVDFNIAGR